jgi:hypothetical protein
VTTRRPLVAFENACHLALGPLDERASVDLLTHLIGADLAVREPAAVAAIVRLCERLPLALRIAGARLVDGSRSSTHAFTRRLANERHRLDELVHGDLEIRRSLSVSYRHLRSDPIGHRAAGLLKLLGMRNQTDIDRWLAARLVEEPVEWAEVLLERLASWQFLIPEGGEHTYRIPDLVRLFAREQLLTGFEEHEQRALQVAITT